MPARCSGATRDYEPAIWGVPPLDQAIHERSFGLWRADGSPKPAVEAVAALTGTERLARADDYTWIDIEPEEFFVIRVPTSAVSTAAIGRAAARKRFRSRQNGDTGGALTRPQMKEINVMEDLPTTLAERVDELISSHQRQDFVSTMGTQAALQELTARVAGLELAVREIAREVQARADG